ncbi:MAG: Uma2 family endonuclease [Myxococcales bacterium]|nr:Uma2 family endonuclease [Myxococcales bacterium]
MTIEPLRRDDPGHSGKSTRPDVKYVRPIRPLHFPASDPEWDMGQSHRHLRLCEVLYQLLCGVLPGEHAAVGADQFVYFDPQDPRRKCAPDAFVKLGVPAQAITSWKTWERGAPDLCVEILSPSDTEEKQTLPEKLERFGAMGVLEVVVFDADAPVGARIRAWESVKGDLVERVVEKESTFSVVLRKWFVVAPYLAEGLPAIFRLEAALRLADDEDGTSLVPTPDERRLAEETAPPASRRGRPRSRRGRPRRRRGGRAREALRAARVTTSG